VNFHVAKTIQGELRTIKAVHGRYYSFYLAAAAVGSTNAQQQQQQLVITELDNTQAGQQLQLELLDVGADGACGQWGNQLPTRLKELYSHWLCR
jgi:hypothetical protein